MTRWPAVVVLIQAEDKVEREQMTWHNIPLIVIIQQLYIEMSERLSSS